MKRTPKRRPENYLLFEKDGDFNPTWLFVGLYVGLGAYGCIRAMESGKQAAMIAVLSFLATTIVALLVSALPISKAKVLANSTAVGEAGKAVASVGNQWPDDGIRPARDLDDE